MVYTQQYFQDERSYNGGHYRQSDERRCTIASGSASAVCNGRAELVIDFYHP